MISQQFCSPDKLLLVRYIAAFITVMRHVKLAVTHVISILVSPSYGEPQIRIQGQLEKTYISRIS